MLEHLAQNGFPWPSSPFGYMPEPGKVLLLLLLFSVTNAFMIVRLVSGVRILTFPISLCLLFVVALYANRLGAEVQFEGINEMQRIAGITTLSQIPTALALLIAFKSQNRLGA